ncbi:thioredoxin-like domain-containing protein [Hymenobacter koreensis]|uniref:TlpA family protein disulfide reductase n=1 Tax=Hymenobacter koreensis TaxID=1084523 RepID=A0ABP8IYM2_9BACT
MKLHRQYRGRGFEVYSVSIDELREKWVQAVAQDSLDWVHVSDLRGFESPVVRTYAAESIPLTLLLDPQGRIVARNLRGAELAEKVATLIR